MEGLLFEARSDQHESTKSREAVFEREYSVAKRPRQKGCILLNLYCPVFVSPDCIKLMGE